MTWDDHTLIKTNLIIFGCRRIHHAHVLHVWLLIRRQHHDLLLLEEEGLGLLRADLIELLTLAWQEKDFFALHLALLCDQMTLNVAWKAFNSRFHGLLLIVWVVLQLFRFFEDLLVAFTTLVYFWSEFTFPPQLLLFFIPLVPDAIIDLVAPNLISLEERGSLSVLVRKVIATWCGHDGFKSALFHLLDLIG